MILLYDQPTPKDERAIRQLVGFPFSWRERLKDRPIGSPRLDIESTSPQFLKHLGSTVDQKFVSIERRTKGVIVYLRNPKNNYVWAIPYYQLSVFKGQTFNLHAQGLFMRIRLKGAKPSVFRFLDKMMDARLAFLVAGQK